MWFEKGKIYQRICVVALRRLRGLRLFIHGKFRCRVSFGDRSGSSSSTALPTCWARTAWH